MSGGVDSDTITWETLWPLVLVCCADNVTLHWAWGTLVCSQHSPSSLQPQQSAITSIYRVAAHPGPGDRGTRCKYTWLNAALSLVHRFRGELLLVRIPSILGIGKCLHYNQDSGKNRASWSEWPSDHHNQHNNWQDTRTIVHCQGQNHHNRVLPFRHQYFQYFEKVPMPTNACPLLKAPTAYNNFYT